MDALSLEECTGLVKTSLETYKTELRKSKVVNPSLIVMGPEREPVALPFPPALVNSIRFKEALFESVRAIARAIQLSGVIFVSDTYTFTTDPEDDAWMEANWPFVSEVISSQCGVDEVVRRLGHGRKVDSIAVVVQSPVATVLGFQHYEILTDGRVVFGKHEIVARNIDDPGTGFDGRMKIWPLEP